MHVHCAASLLAVSQEWFSNVGSIRSIGERSACSDSRKRIFTMGGMGARERKTMNSNQKRSSNRYAIDAVGGKNGEQGDLASKQ